MTNLEYIIINDEINCNKICDDLAKEDYLAIDTEFFTRKNSFHLSIIQISSFNANYIFDMNFHQLEFPISLKKLLENDKIIKIFHAHQQDYQILDSLNIKIKNIFDTQIAMMFLSATEIYSYSELVKKFLQLKIEKLHKNDDWEKRPLSESQINYAIEDTFYLYKIYPILLETLKKENRLSWAQDYMHELINDKKEAKINELIKKYNIQIDTPEKQHKFELLYDLIHEIMPKYILKNIIEAKNLTENRINHIAKGCNCEIKPEIATEILKILKKTYGESELNQNISQTYDEKSQLTYDETQIFLMLKYFLRQTSFKYSIASKLICDKHDLIKLIKGKENQLMRSWRFEIFGKYVLELINGNKAISIKNCKISIF